MDASEPRPPDVAAVPSDRHRLSEEKRKYATRFADKMAICIANGLRERFPGVLPDEHGRGEMEFFDVEAAPPRTGRPRNLLNYTAFLDEIEKAYLRRNASEFEWADDGASDTDEAPPDNEA